jgi:5'-phosphate synthase pdxT subunit
VLDGRSDQWSYGVIDVAVRRNGYGRQIASFEASIDVPGTGTVPGVFIRAPKIERWSEEVEVLATHDHGDGEHPVLVRQGNVWGCSFHPELTGDAASTSSSSRRSELSSLRWQALRGRRN